MEPKENKMGVMPIKKLLVTMAAPMILSMLVQALYNIVDSAFVSRISQDALTAISLAFPMQNLMIAVATGTGVGINAMLSKSLGEKNEKNVRLAAVNGVFLAVCSYVLFLVLGIFGSRIFFAAQVDSRNIVELGTKYLTICLTCSFGVFVEITFERLLQSTGKTVYTMFTQMLGAVINIILDPILIFGLLGFPKMGIAGAAAATVIGQIAAGIAAVIINRRVNKEIKVSFKGFRPNGKVIKRIYAVGFPSVLMVAIGSLMNFSLNKIFIRSFPESISELPGAAAVNEATVGTTAVAVFGVYFKLQSFIFMPIFGLNNGMVPIVAYNYGAKKRSRVTGTIKLGVAFAVCIMFLGFLVFQFAARPLLGIFKVPDNPEAMYAVGVPALKIISLHFLVAGFNIVCSSAFQALGNGLYSLIISAARQIVVLIPAAFLLSLSGNVNAVWWSFPIAEVMSLILSSFFLKRIYDKKLKNL